MTDFDCCVCGDVGCEYCPRVDPPKTYDGIVDKLLAEGYDRDEAELLAAAELEPEAA